jgi:hypothetical protein
MQLCSIVDRYHIHNEEFGREKQGYCSDIAVINILFGHPAKTLAE